MVNRLRFHFSPLAGLVVLVGVLAAIWLAPAAVAHGRGHGRPAHSGPSHSGLPHGGPSHGRPPHGGPPPHPTPPPPSYLALGDSLAFGYSQAKFEHLLPNENPAAYDTGYVDDFAHLLRIGHPTLQAINDGCPGETTESFIKGPCEYQLAFPLHHPYVGGPASSQLSDALAYLHANPNTNPITLDIGANDALGVIEHTCEKKVECVMQSGAKICAAT